MDLIVRSARRRHRADLVDIGIAEGSIQRIEPRLTDRARENPTNGFEDSIAIMREVKRGYTVDDVADRATRVIQWLVGHGVTFIRSYVDVDSIVGLTALEGVLAARERCRRLAHVELIAFPQEASSATRAPTVGW